MALSLRAASARLSSAQLRRHFKTFVGLRVRRMIEPYDWYRISRTLPGQVVEPDRARGARVSKDRFAKLRNRLWERMRGRFRLLGCRFTRCTLNRLHSVVPPLAPFLAPATHCLRAADDAAQCGPMVRSRQQRWATHDENARRTSATRADVCRKCLAYFHRHRLVLLVIALATIIRPVSRPAPASASTVVLGDRLARSFSATSTCAMQACFRARSLGRTQRCGLLPFIALFASSSWLMSP